MILTFINFSRKVITENEEVVIEYKNGNNRVLKYLMGMIMKESKGQANPIVVQNIN